jgi:hypothetical protein
MPEATNDIRGFVTENSVSSTKKANAYMAQQNGLEKVNKNNMNKLLRVQIFY